VRATCRTIGGVAVNDSLTKPRGPGFRPITNLNFRFFSSSPLDIRHGPLNLHPIGVSMLQGFLAAHGFLSRITPTRQQLPSAKFDIADSTRLCASALLLTPNFLSLLKFAANHGTILGGEQPSHCVLFETMETRVWIHLPQNCCDENANLC
jgi:hypothetical protein